MVIGRLWAACTLLAVAGGTVCAAADAAGGVPPARLEKLAKGISFSGWFSQLESGNYSNEHLATHVTAKDAALVKAMGFRHVRFAFSDATIVDDRDPAALDPEKLKRFDAAIDMLLAAGLAVIADFHPEQVYKQGIEKDEGKCAKFVAMWRVLAKHLSARDPEVVYLEVLNEPYMHDSARWNVIQKQALAAMRESAPRHTLIATSAEWSEIYKLDLTEVVADRNVVYNVHCYEPVRFTHQNAPWVGEWVAGLINAPYPSSPEAVAKVLDGLPDEKARKLMIGYGKERWDEAKIDKVIAEAEVWGKKHGVAMTCNEFGVYRKAPAADRDRCLGDLRKSFEKHHIGWTLWEYAGEFGIVTGEPGHRVPDAETVKALGLAGGGG